MVSKQTQIKFGKSVVGWLGNDKLSLELELHHKENVSKARLTSFCNLLTAINECEYSRRKVPRSPV